MPASAILVVGTGSALSATCDESSGNGAEAPAKPIASLEILGQSILDRTIARLRKAGVKTISVVSEAGLGQCFIAGTLMQQARKGFKRVFLIRLGAYAEVDYAELLKFHQDSGASVTRVSDSDGPLDLWVLDTAPVVRGTVYLDSPEDIGEPPVLYLTSGYVNRLNDARDLRRLVVDAFLGRCAMRPRGRETKPGVWIDDGARVHRSARIVAPAYIGRGTRVRASVLITRFSNLERCCLVDRGTVVEDSSMLPHTYIGRGLDVAHAVLQGNRLVHLLRNVAVTVDDPKLMGRTVPGWQSFRYGEKKAEAVRPAEAPAELEPIPQVPARRQHPALRIFSKGEV